MRTPELYHTVWGANVVCKKCRKVEPWTIFTTLFTCLRGVIKTMMMTFAPKIFMAIFFPCGPILLHRQNFLFQARDRKKKSAETPRTTSSWSFSTFLQGMAWLRSLLVAGLWCSACAVPLAAAPGIAARALTPMDWSDCGAPLSPNPAYALVPLPSQAPALGGKWGRRAC